MNFTHRKPSFWSWLSRMLMLGFAWAPIANEADAQPGASLYTIQVVFHVLHQNGNENISDAQIESAITALNEDFDAPTVAIAPPFDTVVGDMDIAFVLATIDPEGGPTSGVDRIETPLTNEASAPDSYLNIWPRNRYLNIWTVHDIDSVGVFCLTQRPMMADGEPCTDGILIYSDYLGAIGTGAPFMTPFLTQAVARYLNLKMLNEDPIAGGPCGDDDVMDTPPCGQPTCLPGPNPCSPMPVNNSNFMYSPYGPNMFTAGQRERVHACLNSPLAQRNELVSVVPASTTDCTVGIHAADAGSHLTIAPMPFHDRITITGLTTGIHQMELHDMSGRIVASDVSVNSRKAVEIDRDLPSGAYVLVISNSGTRISQLVMKD